MDTIIQTLARELGVKEAYVNNVITLIDEGNTIPFIARYRKELHGSMDDQVLRTLADRLEYLRGLEERKQAVKKAIEEQGKLTDELAAAIASAATLAEVEDLYRPYKQKRRTRATAARERGLEPLAQLLFAQERNCPPPEEAARDFIDPDKGVETVADALQGAHDITAEWISDDAAIRKALREHTLWQGKLVSKAATEEDTVYRLYYDFQQPISRLQGHQILAMDRGEREDKSGPAIVQRLEAEGYEVVEQILLADDAAALKTTLTRLADQRQLDLILTTGGTGFGPRDVTPEATMAVATRLAPGIAEAIRAASLAITPRAMLSRAVSVIRGKTLIVNLPGSPKAVCESMDVFLPQMPHALGLLRGEVRDCAR